MRTTDRFGHSCACRVGTAYQRPVVIVQYNQFNRRQIHTVVVAAITSNVFLAGAPGNVRLSPKACGLDKESVVNVSQVITLDKLFLTEKGR